MKPLYEVGGFSFSFFSFSFFPNPNAIVKLSFRLVRFQFELALLLLDVLAVESRGGASDGSRWYPSDPFALPFGDVGVKNSFGIAGTGGSRGDIKPGLTPVDVDGLGGMRSLDFLPNVRLVNDFLCSGECGIRSSEDRVGEICGGCSYGREVDRCKGACDVDATDEVVEATDVLSWSVLRPWSGIDGARPPDDFGLTFGGGARFEPLPAVGSDGLRSVFWFHAAWSSSPELVFDMGDMGDGVDSSGNPYALPGLERGVRFLNHVLDLRSGSLCRVSFGRDDSRSRGAGLLVNDGDVGLGSIAGKGRGGNPDLSASDFRTSAPLVDADVDGLRLNKPPLRGAVVFGVEPAGDEGPASASAPCTLTSGV